jgi:hypothetical protein
VEWLNPAILRGGEGKAHKRRGFIRLIGNEVAKPVLASLQKDRKIERNIKNPKLKMLQARFD